MNRRTCGGLICVLFTFARGAAGAPGARHSLRPLHFEGHELAKTRTQLAPRERVALRRAIKPNEEWRASRLSDMNPHRCWVDQPATRSGFRPNAVCVGARTIVQVSCNCRASAIAGYRKCDSPCHGSVMVINKSRPLRIFVTIDTTKDYSKRAGAHILWSRRRAATFAALQFRAVTMIHRMDRLQAMEMSNGRL